MAYLTNDFLKKLAPDISPALRAEYLKWLNLYCSQYEINTELRIAALLANIVPETGRLTRLVENMNYSASRLRVVWPSRFKTQAIANRYANNPEALANYVYANRNGNGDEASGDGWKYRGGGAMQTTGKGNYKTTGEKMGLDLVVHPEKLRTPRYAIQSACVEFKRRGCNQMADRRELVKIRKAINGGTNGLAEAQRFYSLVMGWLPDGFTLSAPNDLVRLTSSVEAIEPDMVPDTALATDTGLPSWHDETDVSNGSESDALADVPKTDSNGSDGQQTSATGTSESSVTIKDGDIKITSKETSSSGDREQVVVVKPKPKGFFQRIGAKVTAIVTGNSLFQLIQNQFEAISNLSLPPVIWYVISGIVGLGSLIWLVNEIWKSRQEAKDRAELVQLAIKANSTDDNQIHAIEYNKAALYKAKGYKLIRAGEALPDDVEASEPAEE